MSNVLSISAIELVEKLKSGEISCVDACKEYIKRIDKFDKEVKAWAFFDKKLLLEKAEEKDEYRKSGKPLEVCLISCTHLFPQLFPIKVFYQKMPKLLPLCQTYQSSLCILYKHLHTISHRFLVSPLIQ